MMLYRPTPFLLGPGILALAVGVILTLTVALQGESRLHTLILGSLLLIIGYQMLLAWIHFGAFGSVYGFSNSSGVVKKIMSYHSLGRELFIGMFLLVLGILGGIYVLYTWSAAGFGSLSQLQYAVMAMILSILGIQTIFSGMFLSLILLGEDYKSD
jgi:hypothetical protein